MDSTAPRVSWLALVAAGAVLGCALPGSTPAPPRPTPSIAPDVYHRAETRRADRLEQEVARLRDDLRQAEEALVAVESGLRSGQGRADAVSSLAQARIEVERAAQAAPWRHAHVAEARAKLDEADRQVAEGNFGAALFFVYRASRIASLLIEEGREVGEQPGARFVRADRVNLRAGPSTTEDVIVVLSGGTPVFPEGEEREWVLVRTFSGPVGWVRPRTVS